MEKSDLFGNPGGLDSSSFKESNLGEGNSSRHFGNVDNEQEIRQPPKPSKSGRALVKPLFLQNNVKTIVFKENEGFDSFRNVRKFNR